MKFLQSLSKAAWWLLRSSILFFVIIRYISTLKGLNFRSISFYVALTLVVSAAMIFVGGFYKQGVLARVGALFLCIAGGYLTFVNIHAPFDYLSMIILLTSLGLVFLTRKENA